MPLESILSTLKQRSLSVSAQSEASVDTFVSATSKPPSQFAADLARPSDHLPKTDMRTSDILTYGHDDSDVEMDLDQYLAQAEQLKAMAIARNRQPSSQVQNPGGPNTRLIVPLSGPSSAGNISLLHNLVIARQLTLEFEHPQHGSSQWACRLVIRGLPLGLDSLSSITAGPLDAQTADDNCHNGIVFRPNAPHAGVLTIQCHGPFASKKLSKEHAAEVVIPIIQTVPIPASHTDTTENYVGMLLEYHNSKAIQQPAYQIFMVGNVRFACQLTLAEAPGHVFGGVAKDYPSKKAAKARAAQEAVEWLRATGLFQKQTNKKAAKAKRAADMPPATMSSQSNRPENQDAPLVVPDMQAEPDVRDLTNSEASHSQSGPAIVAKMCQYLNIQPPRYVVAPCDSMDDGPAQMFQCHAEFEAGLGLPAAGHVSSILGRRRAKEECAWRVLAYLTEQRYNILNGY